MLQTLYTIPEKVGGVPLFGFGLLLAVWAVASALLIASLIRRQGLCADTLSYLPILLLIGAVIWWVLPKLAAPHGGLPIRGYGVMLFSGVVAGSGLSVWRGYRRGLDPNSVLTLVFWGFVPGILGARTFYVVQYWREYWKPLPGQSFWQTLGAAAWDILNLTEGGLVVYGSLIGGLIGFSAYILRRRLPFWATLDLLAPGMVLGLALGRIGCFLNGCCYGGPCQLPWAVRFPFGTPPHLREVQEGHAFVHGLKVVGNPGDRPVITAVQPGSPPDQQGLKPGQTLRAINGRPARTVAEAQRLLLDAHQAGPELAVSTTDGPALARWEIPKPPPRSRPLHPTQLYSAITALLLCLVLIAYDPFSRRDGELLALLLTLYPIARFLLECIRTDERAIWGTGLSIGQIVSLAFLIPAAGLWFYLLRRPAGRAFAAQETALAG